MKIFITGASGFLASHLFDALVALDHEVYGCDIASDDTVATISKADCRDFARMRREFSGVDVVIHTAAFPHEGLSVFSPSVISDSIYGASVSVFSAAIASGVRRIVNCSSMSRYGAIPSPFRETDHPKPCDPYGVAKLAAERTLECLAEVHGVEWVTAVCHNIYGPRQCRTDPYRNVLAIWMNRILQGNAPVIYGRGDQRRCFSFVDDIIPCFVQMATADNKDILGKVINIGPDHGDVNILAACGLVIDEMSYRGTAIHYNARPAEVHTANCSADRARQLLGFKSRTSLQAGIHKMAEWMREVGPLPFKYHLPIEIVSDKTPKTWTKKEM